MLDNYNTVVYIEHFFIFSAPIFLIRHLHLGLTVKKYPKITANHF